MNHSEFDSEFKSTQTLVKRLFKIFFVFFGIVAFAVLAVWGTLAYLAVTKGPDAIHQIERIGNAYADKLEQENKKSE